MEIKTWNILVLFIDRFFRDYLIVVVRETSMTPTLKPGDALLVGSLKQSLARGAIVVANALYCALITDTGSFKYNSTNSDCHIMAAHLLECGVRPYDIYDVVYERRELSQVKLLASVIHSLKFYNEGELRAEIKGVPNTNLLCLNKSGRWDLFHFTYNLRKTIIKIHPDIVYSFMPGANILSLFSGKLAGNSKLRNSDVLKVDTNISKKADQWAISINPCILS